MIRPIRIVPNYELPPELEKTEILRVVVRENVTIVVCHGLISSNFDHELFQMVDKLIEDIVRLTFIRGDDFVAHGIFTLQIEITEQLLQAESSMHALNALGHAQMPQKHEHPSSIFEEGHGSQPSGTYARPC
jgi:glutamate decarboxylase